MPSPPTPARSRSAPDESAALGRQPRRRQRHDHRHREQRGRSTTIEVGDEPRSVAIDPGNRLRLRRQRRRQLGHRAADPRRTPEVSRRARRSGRPGGELITGAEPWSVVVSPDGQRAFVANSGQDTITVIDVRASGGPAILGHVDAAPSDCNAGRRQAPLPAARPRGHRGQHQALHRAPALVHPARRRPAGRRRGQDRRGLPARHRHQLDRSRRLPAGRADPARAPGHGLRVRARRRRGHASAFPNQLQSIVIRGNRAYLPNIAASPSPPLRFNLDTHAFVNAIGGVNGAPPDRRVARSTCTSARAIRRARAPTRRRGCSSPTPGRSRSPPRAAPATPTWCRRAATCWSSSNVDARRRSALHRRWRHHPLHRPQRPGEPGDGGRERGQEPARHRHHRGRRRPPTSPTSCRATSRWST